MKTFKHSQNPYWIKLGMTGAMLLALGASISFNPESKVIARNEVSGEFSFASVNEKKLDPIELDGKCKGITATAIQVDSIDDKGKKISTLLFQYSKSGTAADVCESCLADVGTKKVPFKDENGISPETPLAFAAISKQLASDAIDQCSSLIKEEKKKSSRKEDLDDEIVYDSKCESPKDMDDIADAGQCQRDELADLTEKCTDDVKDKYQKDVEKARKDRKSVSSIKQNTKTCTKLVKRYFENEMKPVIEMGLQEQLGSPAHNEAVLSLSYITAGVVVDPFSREMKKLPFSLVSPTLAKSADELLRRGNIKSANKFYSTQLMQQRSMCQRQFGLDPNACKIEDSVKLARLKTQTYLNDLKLSEGQLIGTNSLELDNRMESLEYSLAFQNSYTAPISSLASALGDTRQGNLDVAALLNQYLNGSPYLSGGSNSQISQGNPILNPNATLRNSGRTATANLPVFVGSPVAPPGATNWNPNQQNGQQNSGRYPVTPGMTGGATQQPGQQYQQPQYPQPAYPQPGQQYPQPVQQPARVW